MCIIILLECGEDLRGSGEIATPFYPQNYQNARKCVWQLYSVDQLAVELNIKDFDLPDSVNCTEVHFQ